MVLVDKFEVTSPNVSYTDEFIQSSYDYQSTSVNRTADGKWVVEPSTTKYEFRVDRKVPKFGYVVMCRACIAKTGAD
jgi:myo-inositol-1-phosphate synthase